MNILSCQKFQRAGVTLEEAARKIRLVAMDIDGVLTDGRIGYTGTPDEIKFFHVRDGSGITMLRRTGILVGAISGRRSKANQTRAAELKLDFLVEECWNKAQSLHHVAQEHGMTPEQCLFLGDDLIDGWAMASAGVGVAVGDAAEGLLPAADLQTRAFGGQGALRETAEWLMKLQGTWESQLKHYHIPQP
ncbi:MAG: KdsC family phosphatase [Oligosphaeraceae bacterium]